MHMMENFLSDEGIVTCALTRDKTTLKGPNNIIQIRSDLMNKKFRDSFRQNIHKRIG